MWIDFVKVVFVSKVFFSFFVLGGSKEIGVFLFLVRYVLLVLVRNMFIG